MYPIVWRPSDVVWRQQQRQQRRQQQRPFRELRILERITTREHEERSLRARGSFGYGKEKKGAAILPLVCTFVIGHFFWDDLRCSLVAEDISNEMRRDETRRDAPTFTHTWQTEMTFQWRIDRMNDYARNCARSVLSEIREFWFAKISSGDVCWPRRTTTTHDHDRNVRPSMRLVLLIRATLVVRFYRRHHHPTETARGRTISTRAWEKRRSMEIRSITRL